MCKFTKMEYFLIEHRVQKMIRSTQWWWGRDEEMEKWMGSRIMKVCVYKRERCVCVCLYVCVFICVCVRERAREREFYSIQKCKVKFKTLASITKWLITNHWLQSTWKLESFTLTLNTKRAGHSLKISTKGGSSQKSGKLLAYRT